jgi:group I intron endonuclease
MERIGIYLITNTINGHQYIGKANDIDIRWRVHRWHGSTSTKVPTKLDLHLYRAMRKYGIDNFNFEVILLLGEKDNHLLTVMEKYFIKQFHTFHGDPEWSGGYNETEGGEGISRPMPESQKQNISKALIGKKRLSMQRKPSGMKNKKHSELAKQLISNKLIGHSFWGHSGWKHNENDYNDEVRTKMSISHIGKRNYGWKPTDEQREKMSKAKKGKPAMNKGIPRTESQKEIDRIIKLKKYLERGKNCIKCTHKESNEIRYFVSTNEAATQLVNLSGAMSTVQHILDNPSWVSSKLKSKTWKILKDWKIEYCSQFELCQHRPELK